MFDFQEIPARVGKKPAPAIHTDTTPYWIEMINDLVVGAGYSYSRIAYRVHVSPSTIQKLATHPKRKPRLRVFHPLLGLYYKVFQGQYVTPKAREYWANKQEILKKGI